MPFVTVEIGSSTAPILLPHKGISALRHAHPPNITVHPGLGCGTACSRAVRGPGVRPLRDGSREVTLFDPPTEATAVPANSPLAARMRPRSLDEVVGQRAPAGARLAVAPAGRGRRADVADPVRPARHGQDHGRPDRLDGDEPPLRAAVGAQRRGQGRARGDRRGADASSAAPAGRPCCSSTRSTASPRRSRTRCSAPSRRATSRWWPPRPRTRSSRSSRRCCRAACCSASQPLDDDDVAQLVDRALADERGLGRRGRRWTTTRATTAAHVCRRRAPRPDRAGGRRRAGAGRRPDRDRPGDAGAGGRHARQCATTATATSTTT